MRRSPSIHPAQRQGQGERSSLISFCLLDEQLEDGGWNCAAPSSKRSSFYTTICVLEGLLEYEKTRGATSAVTHARVRAQEYLLQRRMFTSLTSGEVVDRGWVRYSFPTTWHYDVLRGLNYLRSAGVEPDDGSPRRSNLWRRGGTRTGAGR